MNSNPNEVFTTWMGLRASEQGLHALDIAQRVGTSECELLASACGATGGVQATRLEADWATLVAQLRSLNQVKTVTRNPSAVIEVEGVYDNVEFFGAMGQAVGALDLRIFIRRWKHGFAVVEETRRGLSRGLQFFDGAGRAIHKLYLRPESDSEAFDALVHAHTSKDQGTAQQVSPPEAAAPTQPDAQVDVEGLRKDWRAITDTHQFFGLLRKFGVTRTQALRLAGEELAHPLEPKVLEQILHHSRDTEMPFMVFVGNPGLIQIRTGVTRKVAWMGPWLNVLDPGFNLHVRMDAVHEAWLVRKPTSDGNVTAVELYDREGEQIALMVGKRKPGAPESGAWRELVERLPRLGAGPLH